MFNPFFSNSHMFGVGMGFFTIGAILFFLWMIVAIALKGYALWNAAQRKEKGWFVALLVINTMGILELIYLYFIAGKWRHMKVTEDKPKDVPPTTPPPAASAQ